VFVPQHLFCLEVLQQPTAHKGAQDTFLQCGLHWGHGQTLHRSFVKVLGNPAVQARLGATGFDPAPAASVSEFTLFIRDQVAFWGDLVKSSGASAD
jgi:tripartite-type tricarboxylate transporter receptor subunit TctC